MMKHIIYLFLAVLLFIGIGNGVEYYIFYNFPAEPGSVGNSENITADVTELISSVNDSNHTLLRIFDIPTNNYLSVPRTCSKLTAVQWNDTEMQEGGFNGALAFFGIDQIQDIR